MYTSFIKPLSDLFAATVLFLILLPVFLIILTLLAIYQKGNPFFLQERPGKNERLFTIIKFRTMNNKRDKDGRLLPDKDRLTGIGKFIRTTSLDEIPQLLNVISGKMSLVGPRPLLPEYLELYNDFQRKRHLVKPGITGLAQVSGRNELSWEKKFEYDVDYVKKCSFILDFGILLKTVKKVIIREGINKESSATTSRFTGKEDQ